MNLYPNMIGDSRFLNDLGGYTERYSLIHFNGFRFHSICNKVTAAWSQFGISVSPAGAWQWKNKYYINGQEISREEAMRRACQQVGKSINDMNFTDY